MPLPLKTCVVCGEEFVLKPDKPGFANRCPECSEPEASEADAANPLDAGNPEINEARRKAMRDLLYRSEN
jgi:hypothetical protein